MEFNIKNENNQVKTAKKKILKRIGIVFLCLLILIIFVFAISYLIVFRPLLKLKDNASRLISTTSLLKDDLYKADQDAVKNDITSIKNDISNISEDIKSFKKIGKNHPYIKYINNVENILINVETILTNSEEDILHITTILTQNGPKINENYGKPAEEPSEEQETEENICGTEEDELLDDILKKTEAESKTKESSDSEYLRPFGVKELIKALPTISKIYNDNEEEILAIVKEVNSIDKEQLKTDILLIKPFLKYTDYKIEDIDNYINMFNDLQSVSKKFEETSPEIKLALEKLPELLGAEKPVTYLLVPQNEKELRSSGGLLTAYGLLTVEKGEIIGDISTVDMWDLENYTKYELGKTPGYKNIGGQLTLMLRGCGETALRAQDSGIYADNYISMDMFKDYYDIARQYNPSKYKAYDHLITFNTFFPSDLIKVVEPLELENGDLLCAKDTAKTIFENTSVNYTDFKNRKSYIGQVGGALEDELFDLPARDLLKVMQIVLNSFNAKHISFYSADKDMQSFFDSLNLTARTNKDFDGDYFQLNEAQNCALKANFYIYDTVTQDIIINEETGNVEKTVTVKWVNEQVVSGDKKEGNILSPLSAFRYRAWIRYYSPKGARYSNKSISGMTKILINGIMSYISNDNFYTPKQFFDEGKMDKQVYDDIIWFDHRRFSLEDSIKTASHSIKITAPDDIKYTEEEGYRLLIQKHPGKRKEKYIINVKYGNETESTEFVLNRDKILTFKDGNLTVEDNKNSLDSIFEMIDFVRNF